MKTTQGVRTRHRTRREWQGAKGNPAGRPQDGEMGCYVRREDLERTWRQPRSKRENLASLARHWEEAAAAGAAAKKKESRKNAALHLRTPCPPTSPLRPAAEAGTAEG